MLMSFDISNLNQKWSNPIIFIKNYKPCKMITAKGKTRIGKGFLVAPNGDISKII